MSSPRGWSEEQATRLRRKLQDYLATESLPAPHVGQSEVDFTASVLLPAVLKFTEALGRAELVVSGDGGASPRAVEFLDFLFYPDIAIAAREQPLVACEVKILRSDREQGAIPTGLGQAFIYQQQVFASSLLILVDTSRSRRKSSSSSLEQGIDAGIILRKSVRGKLEACTMSP
jgi:hypothetical protein